MDATTKRQLGRALEADVEPGSSEDPWVGMRRGDEHGEEGAGRNPQAPELKVLSGDPPDDRDRRPHAHDLLDRPCCERGFFGEPRPLGRMLKEGDQRAAKLVAGGVLSREHQRRHHEPEFRIAQLVAGLFRRNERGDQIGPWRGAACGEQVIDARVQTLQRGLDAGQVLGHGVTEGETQIVRPAVELCIALARDAKQLTDDP